MKLNAIGDVHGRDTWKQVDSRMADRVIFLGDYVDSRQNFTDADIYGNLQAIIDLKRRKPNKVILLLGNHDAQYLHYPRYQCSGFRPAAQSALTALFNRHNALFQIAYQHKNVLFTHAGLSNSWYQHRKDYLDQIGDNFSLADQLNAMHQRDSVSDLLFEVGPARWGDARFGGPVWADKTETIADYLPGYHQVVGHTAVNEIMTIGDDTSSITYCDVTQTRADFYEINV